MRGTARPWLCHPDYGNLPWVAATYGGKDRLIAVVYGEPTLLCSALVNNASAAHGPGLYSGRISHATQSAEDTLAELLESVKRAVQSL